MPFEHKYFVKMPELQDLLKSLIKKRGGYKSCITVALNRFCSLSIDDLTKENFLRRQEAIEQYLQKVQDCEKSSFVFEIRTVCSAPC